MLWMKAWLETRWRLIYALAIPLTGAALPYIMGSRVSSAKDAHGFVAVMAFFVIFNAGFLAGAGIRTQPAFGNPRGLYESMYYTLSLPVSRLRLLLVRAGVGLLEFVGVAAVVYTAAWLLYPPLRETSTALDLLKLILAAVTCTACFYFISVLLATFLSDPWQMFGGLFVTMVVWLVASRFPPPPQVNVFGFARAASPLITHTFPWSAMAVSVIVSAILFFAALRIVQRREY